MYRLRFNYDELLKTVPYKFSIPVLVGKRAERVKEEMSLRGEHAEIADLVASAFQEISDQKIKIKNEDILKLLKPSVK